MNQTLKIHYAKGDQTQSFDLKERSLAYTNRGSAPGRPAPCTNGLHQSLDLKEKALVASNGRSIC